MANKTFQKTLLGCSIALMSAFVAGNASAAKKVDDTYSRLNQCIGYYNQSQYTQAIPCFTPLAKAGNDQAQTYLGIMYQHGFGTTKDMATAAQWYNRAARQGDQWAYDNLKAMGNPKLATGKTWADYKNTVEQKAAAGDAQAQTALGSLYYYGVGGVKQDYDTAKNWYAKAAVNGDATAMNYIGRMYYYALGVEQNSMMAKQYLNAAAKAGSVQARALLKKMK